MVWREGTTQNIKILEGISSMRKNGVVCTDFSVQPFSSFICQFQLKLIIISRGKQKKEEKREHIRNSLKGNEHFQIWNSSFLCILREKYTGFALSCKYTTWFWAIILKWQLKIIPSQNKLLFNSHCTTCGVFLPPKNQEKMVHFIDKSV